MDFNLQSELGAVGETLKTTAHELFSIWLAVQIAELGIAGYGFAPLRLPHDLDFTGMFHGVDERVPLDALTFGERVLTNAMLKSTAISDASITKQTLYEVTREQFTRSTYDRALESMNQVNAEIEALVEQAWSN